LILVDSSVWIDYFRGNSTPESDLLDSLLPVRPLATGDLILAEILQGTDSDREFESVRAQMATLEVVIIGGADIAVQSARNYRLLRSKGITIRKTIDTLIATRCIKEGLELLFSDRDFEPFVAHLGLQSAVPD
jgi:predicted nucleic acid-binding protein